MMLNIKTSTDYSKVIRQEGISCLRYPKTDKFIDFGAKYTFMCMNHMGDNMQVS